MAVAIADWLDLIEREYLRGYLAQGGASVKFAVGGEDDLAVVAAGLNERCGTLGLAHVALDAATTRLHMIQDLFFAISRTLDWHALAQRFVERMFERNGYQWPVPGRAAAIQEVAERNSVDVTFMRRDVRQWLSADIMRDAEMTQDFRLALIQLCQRRLEPEDDGPGLAAAVLEWLNGDLRRLGALKEAFISAKITRHNGRAMLRSLCRWLRLCGGKGLCLVVDIRQLGKAGSAAGDGIRYSPAAVMDGFEVLRQLIDDSEHFAGLLVVVLADQALIEEDPKRSLDAYLALKMRIWDDVRAERRDNPLAPLVRLAAESDQTPLSWAAAP